MSLLATLTNHRLNNGVGGFRTKGENDVIYTDIESIGFISPCIDTTEEQQEGIDIIEN